ncbi:helix-turn-helix domain-containing protein [Pelagibacterium xiamenense]|uniref:helix-turn-helix domain-containing protein n=1 Tax=Pelagibacterium xiamenense TaxID=2901140 RepID=UPI001E298C5F|nr:helix-turn-helix transcriptional regulator [Pelagibacterium xiamenense]MCD7059119.1 helix-turn-helix domain-containing protein [Pelagibacterium xiamenense]
MDSFSDTLRRRAADLGISNAEVARRAGLTERRYGNYVSGRREPDLATLVRIARVLETTPNVLLGFEEIGSNGGDALRAKINSAVAALGNDDREILAACAEAIVKLRSG